MTNNFTTIKENQASRKFYLTRLNPARYSNDSLVLDSGIYKMNFPFIVSHVEANGVLLTKVVGVPAVGQYSWNEATGEFRTGEIPSSSNAIIIYYYLFYTSERFRIINETPDNSLTPQRDWQPKLKGNPSIGQSIENVINSKLSISNSAIQIINEDNEFHNYLTVNDSFNKKTIEIWLCLDDIENIKKIFKGKIIGVKNIKKTTVQIQFEDNLTIFNKPCLLGDSTNESYFTASAYPNIDPSKLNRPRKFIFGTVSKYKLINEIGWPIQGQFVDPYGQSMEEAACINSSLTISQTTNRSWGLCRTLSDGFIDFGFTPSSIDNVTYASMTIFDGTAPQIGKFIIGDTFKVTQGITTAYCRIVYIDTALNKLYTSKATGITTGAIIHGNNCPSIVIYDPRINTSYYPLYDRDYTASISTSSSGNKILDINFVNNFETNFAGMMDLDPSTVKVQYRVRPVTTNMKHGSVLKFLIERSGLSTNALSFSNANTDFPVLANFSIPYFDEQDFNPYLKYIEDLLASTIGFIGMNNDFEIFYKLFQSLTGATKITTTDIMDQTYSIDIDYRDIVTEIIAYNPHHSSYVSQLSNATAKSDKSKFLHGIDKTIRFRHLLEDYSTRILDLIAIRTERKAVYSFDTKILNIDSNVGDEFELQRDAILGGELSKKIKILSLNKQIDKTSIICTDLYNI